MSFSLTLTTLLSLKKNSSSPKLEKGIVESSFNGINTNLFFVCLFLFQLLFIFQGVDVGDSGSYASFYQQIFHDPQSVQYNFMFWASGIIGGLFTKLFPSSGIWGIRFLGVLISTSTIIITYNLLKKYLNIKNLQLSLFILTLFINNNPKEFYYNNFSALLYILTASLLFSGLKNNKPLNIFLSGACIALNMFNRFPNLLGLGLIIPIFYYGYLHHENLKKQIKNALFLLTGFISAVAAIISIMYLLGHLQIYSNTLEMLFAMGKGAKHTNGTEGNDYGIFKLIKVLTKQYLLSILSAVIFFLFVLIVIPVLNNFRKSLPVFKPVITILKYFILILLIAFIITGKIDNIILLYFFTGLSLTTAVLVLASSKSKDVRFLLVLGCFIALVHPMGSSEGIHTVIIYSLWLCFPIALDFLFKLKFVNIDLRLFSGQNDFSTSFFVSEYQLREIKRAGIGIIIFACLFYSYFYPYFDKGNRLNMTYSINNKYMKSIYTTEGRANALNELLNESSKYVKPNDYVLAYDCIPLYYYLTETRPYLKNPWPWLYQSNVFKNELYTAASENKTLPVVITQIVKTMGDGGNWPYNPNPENSLTWKLNEDRNNLLNEFLKNNHYHQVWTNKCFKIFLPGKS